MPRTFACLRVSTAGQTTENQKQQSNANGIAVDDDRIVAETVSGSIAAMERPGFVRVVDRSQPGDMLVVRKMDRLERNAMDVSATIARPGEMAVRVKRLDLGDTDLTRGQAAIRWIAGAIMNRIGKLPALPASFPDYAAPVMRRGRDVSSRRSERPLLVSQASGHASRAAAAPT